MTDATPDLANLPRFISHLYEVDAEAAVFARQLLKDGAEVLTFWGPVQMDVWELRVQRREMIVRFGIERGYSDGVVFSRVGTPAGWSNVRLLQLAVFAWARANDAPLAFDDPDERVVHFDANGAAALDWVAEGHEDDVDRVFAAWRKYRDQRDRLRSRTRGRPDDADLRTLKTKGLAAMEAAARGDGWDEHG